MDDFGRRQFLSRLFGIPPILLGIVSPSEIALLLEQHRKANSSVVVSTARVTRRKHTIDVQEYQEQLVSLVAAGHSGQRVLSTALASLDVLSREADASQEQAPIQSLLSD